MTRDEVTSKIRECLQHLRADDDKPEYKDLKYLALRPRIVFLGLPTEPPPPGAVGPPEPVSDDALA